MILHPPASSLPLNHFSSLCLLIHEISEVPKECNQPGVNVQHVPNICDLG